jgi:signal transduction histidine kinase
VNAESKSGSTAEVSTATLIERAVEFARLTCTATGAECVAIGWRGGGCNLSIVFPPDHSFSTELLAAIDSIDAKLVHAVAQGERAAEHPFTCATAASRGAVRVVAVAHGGTDDSKTKASLEVLAMAMLAEIELIARSAESELWRDRAGWALDRERAAIAASDSARPALVREMAHRMLSAADSEREHIARELHDDQAQLITAARIALEGGREQARAILARIERDLRARTRALRPVDAHLKSAQDAIALDADRLVAAGIDAELHIEPAASALSAKLAALCCQFIREAVSNVIIHSGAARAAIRLCCANGFIEVEVRDNGKGVAAVAPRRGSGIAGIRERVELMGGRFEVISGADGTVVSARIPQWGL